MLQDAGSIDLVHLDKCFDEYSAADEYTLAHRVQEKGARFGYTYDFGAHWPPAIEVGHVGNTTITSCLPMPVRWRRYFQREEVTVRSC